MNLNAMWKALRAPLIGLVLAVLVGMGILMALGENPRVLLEALYNVCFTGFGLGYTLFYATPLIFTGLSVAVCFRCGLFNIGAEGQLYFGAVAIILCSRYFPTASGWLAIPLGLASSFLAAAVWGGIAGFLKAKRGSHEVITTILLNFVAAAITGYLILYVLHNPDSQNPETIEVASSYRIPLLHDLLAPHGISFFRATPVNVSLFIALATAVLCTILLFRTTFGFTLRSVGFNAKAAEYAGVSVDAHTIFTMALGGGLAGLVGLNEVMGHQHKVIDGFSPQYGFTGIAVALLARSHPLGVILSAFLFGALHNSARELEFLSDIVAKELAFVLQGVLIAFVAANQLYEKWWASRIASERDHSTTIANSEPERVPVAPLPAPEEET